ncbi:5-oxoprolinase subunit B/C family protein [Cellulomonas alba]|uniref:Urea amidolyase family protein n=1 Tax=Cellulomonas alba TaxID=3053467 RepID=A0ABT7SEA4_9CELL|nr:urea amidolyase family protein [Cellulomonas alba]MDM7854461.1 urea amidolyase family protein [Cellulomonas alba]
MTADAWSVAAFGDDAVLVTLPDLTAVRDVDAALRSARRAGALAGVVDQVPAAASVLLRVAAGADLETLVRDVEGEVAALAGATVGTRSAGEPAASELVTLPVRYDGPDLDEVAGLTGLTRDEVVRRHAAAEYTVAFGGFMPGFAYLVGLDPALHVPRRESPRERVPAGAVAIADRFSAVYSAATPGGWRLLGTCDVALFDVDRDPPALLTPGTRVRFRGVPAADPAGPRDADLDPDPDPDAPERAAPPALGRTRALTVLDPGTLTLVEDLGRAGWAHVGVGRAGAADAEALALANRLVGNAEGAAGLEVLLGGLRVRADRPVTVALAGAPGAADVDGHPVGRHAPIELAAGQVLHVGTASRGLRVYLAVRGGLDVVPVLGSRSADQLAGIGPAPLAAGDALPVGPAPADLPPVDVAPVRDWASEVVLHLAPGPHAAWVEGGLEALDRSGPWLVTPATNRVALRLDGTPLRRVPEREHAELPPAGLVPGAVQVPPDGRPIVFGIDHPVTGGYPVLAVVRRPDLHWLAQLRPGERVRFVVR